MCNEVQTPNYNSYCSVSLRKSWRNIIKHKELFGDAHYACLLSIDWNIVTNEQRIDVPCITTNFEQMSLVIAMKEKVICD